MKDEKIIVVGPVGYETGGIAQYISEQVRHLSSELDIETFDISAPQDMGYLYIVGAMAKWLYDICRAIGMASPSITHIHVTYGLAFYRECLFGVFAKNFWKSDVIIHVHGSEFDDFLSSGGRIQRSVRTWLLSHASIVICLSEYWENILQEHTDHDHIEVLPNAVDVNDYQPVVSDGSTVTISFVSDLEPRKGIQEFISAIEGIEIHDSVQVEIAGKGSLSDEMEQLGDHNNVEYHGFISEIEKFALLNRSDIFVLPSHAEGLPITILEAMAGGNAIVTTKVGSIPEVINQKNGLLVEPKHVDELTEAISQLLDDPDRTSRMGTENRKLVENEYSWLSHKNKLLNIYNKASRPE